MRYDDTLETVLAADVSTSFGKASAWRQLVDLIGRRRVAADARAFNLLRRIRDEVPVSVRAASARALEAVNPPASLVALCALDEISVSAPVLRSARLSSGEWVELLPRLSSAARTVLRARRDLPPGIDRALESFGPVDFVISDDVSVPEVVVMPEPVVAAETDAIEADARESAAEPVEAIDPVAPPAEPVEAIDPVEPLSIDWREVLAEEDEAPEPTDIAPVDAVDAETVEAPSPAPRARIRLRPVLEPLAEPMPEAEPEAEVVSEPVEAMAQLVPAQTSTFVPIGAAALGIPVVAQALGRGEPASDAAVGQSGTGDEPLVETAVAPESDAAQVSDMAGDASIVADRDDAAADDTAQSAPELAPEGPFEIAEVVARIDAFYTRQQERRHVEPPPRADGFRFETDEQGVIRWVDGVSRAPLIGLSLELNANGDGSRADGVAAGALRQRAPFADARLTVMGESDAAGEWRMSAAPAFDPATGRFAGYRGTARRPRREEVAAAPVRASSPGADSLRQLMHELRTPTNAIAGFAEMIEREILGDAPPVYRERAGAIRMHARALLAAIDDLDIAARIEASAFQLSDGDVALRPLLSRIADDLAALAELRGAWIALPVDTCAVRGDARVIERMLARMIATLVSAAGDGERIGVQVSAEAELVSIRFDRPTALTRYADEAVFGIDDEQEDAALLGTGFALRLVRNIARELSGQFITLPDAFVIQLPATVTNSLEQAR